MRRGWLGLVVWLLGGGGVSAQTVDADRASFGGDRQRPVGSSLRLEDLGTSGGTYVLIGDAADGGNIRARLLGKSDLPSTVGYTDEAETWSLLQTFSGGAALADGSAGTPGLRWTSDTNTGLFRAGNDILGFSAGGTERARLSSAGLSMAVPVTTGSGALQLGSASGPVNPAAATNTLGSLQAPWLSLDVLELHARRFIADETIAFTGGSGIWSRGTTLTRDVDDADSVIYVRHSSLRYGDFIVLRDLSTTGVPQYEVMQICSAAGVLQVAGDYAYCVDRNEDGTGANDWVEGQAVVSTDRLVNVYSSSPTRLSYWGSVLADRPLLAFNFAQSPAVDLTGSGATATTGSGAIADGSVLAGGASVPGMVYRNGSAGAIYSGIDPGTRLNGTAGTCAVSVEIIVRIPNGGASGTQAYILQKGAPGSSANHLAVLHTADGRFYLLGAPDGTWAPLTPQTAAFTSGGTYQHLVFTWDSTNGGRTYVNGVETGTPVAAPGGCLTPNASTISGDVQWVSGQTIAGGLSELAIYGYVLSPSQIRAHQEARTVGLTSLQHGPTITGEERTSTTDWHGLATRWAIGQLQGIADYDTPTMGFWAGDEEATWVSADAVNGFRVGNDADVLLQADADGDLALAGSLTVSGAGTFGAGGAILTEDGMQLVMDVLNVLPSDGTLVSVDEGSVITFEPPGGWSGKSLRFGGWTYDAGGGIGSWGATLESIGTTFTDNTWLTMRAANTFVTADTEAYVQVQAGGQNGNDSLVWLLSSGDVRVTADRLTFGADNTTTIGAHDRRAANINLALASNSAPTFVVVNKGGGGDDANTALGYISGFTGTCSAASFTVVAGVITAC